MDLSCSFHPASVLRGMLQQPTGSDDRVPSMCSRRQHDAGPGACDWSATVNCFLSRDHDTLEEIFLVFGTIRGQDADCWRNGATKHTRRLFTLQTTGFARDEVCCCIKLKLRSEDRRMQTANQTNWLESVVQLQNGYEADAVGRFSDRLLRLASSRLPERLNRRVDPEDIVQSVFRSFFNRHTKGRFQFEEAPDVWRLLAAMTYRKVQKTIRHHGQQQRDFSRDTGDEVALSAAENDDPTASSWVVMMELLEGILQQLPATHQQIVQLRLDGYSVEEIAAQVGVSSRTVDRALAVTRKVASEMIEES